MLTSGVRLYDVTAEFRIGDVTGRSDPALADVDLLLLLLLLLSQRVAREGEGRGGGVVRMRGRRSTGGATRLRFVVVQTGTGNVLRTRLPGPDRQHESEISK